MSDTYQPRVRGTALAAAMLLLATPVVAQQRAVRATSGGAPATVAQAVRALPGAPDLDGRLDDAAWQSAPVIDDFLQLNPDEGEQPTERTEVRVLYTDAAMYIGVRAWDSDADKVAAKLTRRDEESPSDWVGVMIDSYRDRRTAFGFMVNPVGVKRDIYLYDDTNEDESWDAVWDVSTSRDAEGWSAEFRIPFSQLRFPNAEQLRFGFNVYRFINRKNEELYWKLVRKTESGAVSRFGDLEGIEGITPPRRLEIQPYSVVTQGFSPEQAGNPFQTGSDRYASMGADLKYGITSNMTLDATINPDFGQVEADPAVVNLSAFESFFPEKRPFFNEGIDIFRFSITQGDGDGASESLFYTRRIGRAPQGRADPRGGYADQIQQTTILGAAKLSGKTQNGWTTGLVAALTAEEEAEVIDAGGNRTFDVVEPRSSYFVGRLSRDVRDGKTQIGLFGTATRRFLPENLDFLRSGAYALGVNFSHRFLDDRYGFAGRIVGSRVEGSEEAIELTQRSSARYYQRPDNDYRELDPTRTSLEGFAAQASFNKRTGNWRWATGFNTRSPGFEVNDLGFQRDADRTVQWTWLNRRWVTPGKVFRRFNLNFNQWSSWSYGWDRLGFGGNVNANFALLNYWGGYFGLNRQFNGLSTRATRGGPALKTSGTTRFWFGFWSDDRKSIRGSASFWGGFEDESGGWNFGVSPDLVWQAAANVDLTISPMLNRQFDPWQYLRTTNALNQDRYAFGELNQTTVAMTFRGNMTFTPELSLQLYMEPFVSTGKYEAYKQVADPRAGSFDGRFEVFDDAQVVNDNGDISIDLDRDGTTDFGLGNPDFTFLSFRSNAVLRWEYMPGSTLFFVWQHGRTGFNDNRDFRLGGSVDDLFSAEATNTFVVKVNYWLSP